MDSQVNRCAPRLPPAIMQYPDWGVKLILALLYSSVLLVSFLGPSVQTPLSSPTAQHKRGSLGLDNTWQVDILDDRKGWQPASIIGLSLSENFAKAIARSQNQSYRGYVHRFSDGVSLKLSLEYLPASLPACLLLSGNTPASLQGKSLELHSDRLALFDGSFFQQALEAGCREFEITVSMPAPVDPALATGGLLVERRLISWSDGGKSVRWCVLFFCVAMEGYLLRHSISTRKIKFRLALGIRSSALLVTGVLVMSNPLELFSSSSSVHLRWTAPIGVTLAMCAVALYPFEVHGALTEVDRCQDGTRPRFFSSGCIVLASMLIMFVCVCTSIAIFNSQVSRVVTEAGKDPVSLATAFKGDYWWLLFWAQPAVFACLLIRNIWSLEMRFRKYPYRICRRFSVIHSFAMLVLYVAVLCYLFLLVILSDRWLKSGPWTKLDVAMGLQLLPDPSSQLALTQTILCLVAFVSIVGLRGVREDSTDLASPMTLASCPRSVVGGGSEIQALLDVSLGTVRLLCHCSHVTYRSKRGRDLTEAHLRIGRPGFEDDLDYSALSLQRVIRKESPSDLGLVVFLAIDPVRRLGIVSFRGTANKKNLCHIDFDVRMESPRLPHLAEQQDWSAALVHRGFQTALLSVYDELVAAIQELNCVELWFTGHSMGGALATLLAADFSVNSAARIGVCTFASPRVGNSKFAESFRKSGIRSARVVCDRDPVSDQPLCDAVLNRYVHVHGLVRVTRHGQLVSNPNFLEESLRRLHHLTNWAVTSAKLCCCQVVKDHKIRRYVEALRAVQTLEDQSLVTSSLLPATAIVAQLASIASNDSDPESD